MEMLRWTGGRLEPGRALLAAAAAAACFSTACDRKRPVPEPPAAAPVAAASAAPSQDVQIEMRNLHLHAGGETDRIVLEVKVLRGTMVATRRGEPPVFDDPQSYTLEVSDADVAMDMASLSHLMNRRVFNYDGAPLSHITVEADGSRLKQSGSLHKGVTLPFSMKASVSATTDGRMRLHAETLSTLKIPAKKLMDVFGLSLDDVVRIKDRRGIEIDGDDVIVAPGQALPPPRIAGQLSHVAVANGMLRLTFGHGAAARLAPADVRAENYVYFAGSTIRFGKLTMSHADLMLIDADPKDSFDFSPDLYNAQLVAGYSKNTSSGGLRTYMPDLDDLRPGADLRPDRRERGASHRREALR